ncbi:MAG: PEP-CTERM sorting domain-containing protein [Verrucomicrobiota bacterium]
MHRTYLLFLNSIKPFAAAGALGALLLIPASAQINWTGGGDGVSWFDGANWSGGNVPTISDDVRLANGIATPIVINDASTAQAASIRFQTNPAASSLDIQTDLTVTGNVQLSTFASGQATQGGASEVNVGQSLIVRSRNVGTESFWILSDTASLNVFNDLIIEQAGASNGSYVNQSGNTSVVVNDVLDVGSRASANGGFGYRMSGGTLTVNTVSGGGGAAPPGLGVGYDSAGAFEHTGGTVTVNNGGLAIGNRSAAAAAPNGTFFFADEAILDVEGSVVLGSTNSNETSGVGEFVVSGSGTGSIDVGGWNQRADTLDGVGILSLEVDLGGLFTIEVDGDVFFGLDSILQVTEIDGYVPMLNDTFTVMSWTGGVTNDGLFLDPASGWVYEIQGNDLNITFVPEPTSAALLAGAAGLLALRRRRR